MTREAGGRLAGPIQKPHVLPNALWSAVTCHRFPQATCRRRRPKRVQFHWGIRLAPARSYLTTVHLQTSTATSRLRKAARTRRTPYCNGLAAKSDVLLVSFFARETEVGGPALAKNKTPPALLHSKREQRGGARQAAGLQRAQGDGRQRVVLLLALGHEVQRAEVTVTVSLRRGLVGRELADQLGGLRGAGAPDNVVARG